MSAPSQANGNGKRRPKIALRPYDKDRYNEFHEANGKRPFSPAYNDFLEKIAFDPDIEIETRVMALAILTANGNQSSCCVDADGAQLARADFARILGVRDQRITEAVRVLEARNLLRTEGKGIYPVQDPFALKHGISPDSLGKKRRRGEAFQRFRPLWLEANAERAKQRADAQALLKEINREELAAFKRWQKEQESRTNEGNESATPPDDVRDSPVQESGTPAENAASYINSEVLSSTAPSSSLSSSLSGKQAGSSACLPAPPAEAEDDKPRHPRLIAISDEFPHDFIDDAKLIELDQHLTSKLGPDYEPTRFVEFIRNRKTNGGRIGTGLVFDLVDGLPRDFIKHEGKLLRELRAAAAEQKRREEEEEKRWRQQYLSREYVDDLLSYPEWIHAKEELAKISEDSEHPHRDYVRERLRELSEAKSKGAAS